MEKNNLIVGLIALIGMIAVAAVLVGAGQGQPKPLAVNYNNGNLPPQASEDKKPAEDGTPPAAVNDIVAAPQIDENNKKIMNATIKTSLGEIKVQLFGDKVPQTAGNFVKLAESGFYNGIKFHRVIKGFMIQGGDPLTKDDSMKARWGTGGPGYKFNDEPFTGEYVRGTLAMANSGPNTNGSQFFIMHADNVLPPRYVIFGKVISGIEVVDKIAELKTDSRNCPLDPPVIESVVVEK